VASIERKRTTKGENRYEVRYRAPDGRERSRTFRNRRDAERFSVTVEADKSRGSWIDPRDSALTVEEVSSRWLESNPGKRASTLAADESQLRVHLLPVLGGRRIGSVTRNEVQTLVNRWAEMMRPRSVRRCFGVTRAVFSFAEASDFLAKSPCRGIKLPAVDPTRRMNLSPDDVAQIAESTAAEYRPMVWLGAMTGLRWGEVAALRVASLDLLRSTVTVTEAVTRSRTARFGPPKSDAGQRTLSMPTSLSRILADHLARRGLTGADANALLFEKSSGGPLDYPNWRRRIWQPACIEAGLGRLVQEEAARTARYKGPGFHDLRRANATGLVLAGVDLKTAQTRLGHSDPRLTLAVYAQATTKADAEAADALGAWFARAEGA
jgi:integrase